MKRFMIYLTVIMMMVGIVGTGILPVAANTGTNMFSDEIFTSQEKLKETFNMDNADSVTLIKEDGVPVISVKRDGSPFESNRMISKKRVDAANFVYTVEAAATRISGTQYTEIPIILGVKDGYGSYTQVYINKSVDNAVSVKVAFLEAGKFRTVWSQSCFIDDAEKDSTYFNVRLEVYNDDMDVYVDDEYITTITSSDDYTGYVGVRCTGAIRIKSMSLVELPDDQTENGTGDGSTNSDGQPVFPEDDNSDTWPSDVSDDSDDSDENTGLPTIAIIGIAAGAVAVVGAIVFVVYKKKQGEKK